MFQIRSDKDDGVKNLVKYSLKGVGVDQDPFNLFVVNPDNGNVRITGILDREVIPQYNVNLFKQPVFCIFIVLFFPPEVHFSFVWVGWV